MELFLQYFSSKQRIWQEVRRIYLHWKIFDSKTEVKEINKAERQIYKLWNRPGSCRLQVKSSIIVKVWASGKYFVCSVSRLSFCLLCCLGEARLWAVTYIMSFLLCSRSAVFFPQPHFSFLSWAFVLGVRGSSFFFISAFLLSSESKWVHFWNPRNTKPCFFLLFYLYPVLSVVCY